MTKTAQNLLVAMLLFPACQARDEKGFEPDPEGAWFAGDMHVHATGASNDTGGDSFPQDIKRVAQERGMSFVVLTDHSNSTGSDVTTTEEDPALFNMGPEFPLWDEAARLSDSGFLMIDGNEFSPIALGEIPTDPRGHIGCVPMNLDTFDRDDAIIDRPRGEVSGEQSVAQALARGCFTVINHPFAQASWIRYDWGHMGYHALEIWNGGLGFDEADQETHNTWRCDLLQGRKVTPVGASDNHRVNIEAPGVLLNPALGYPRTSVFAKSLTWPSIMEGLVAGLVAVHEGDSFLSLDTYDQKKRFAPPEQTRIIRLRGTLDSKITRARLTLTRAISCEDKRPASEAPTMQEEVLFVTAIGAGERFDREIHFDVPLEAGIYTAELRPETGFNYFAFSRAIVIGL